MTGQPLVHPLNVCFILQITKTILLGDFVLPLEFTIQETASTVWRCLWEKTLKKKKLRNHKATPI